MSIASTLSSKNIPRLKIGIGRPKTREPFEISLFVTSTFNPGINIITHVYPKKIEKFKIKETKYTVIKWNNKIKKK